MISHRSLGILRKAKKSEAPVVSQAGERKESLDVISLLITP